MCVLCALHRLSQVVPAMLPWLVVPLLALWAASQLLPPPLRFEVTPPRLACGLFLVAVLLWYHVLMPQLLTWQARRTARLQERRRFLAVELQRLRRTAVRRCRNCLTEYRDQNPPAGRFMCCYCGHISKRPVFDLPGSSGIIHELIGKNGWLCPREWAAFGAGGCVPRSTDNSCSRKLISIAVAVIRWICGKVPIVGGSVGDGSGADGKDSGKDEDRADSAESKCEKARRKAEERRQARLEKELQEEEERKQREEVFRLIEEQRKLRDEKLEAVKEALRSSALDGVRDGRKDSGKKRNGKKKEKDWPSSKSNSDVEEFEKRACREGERRCEVEKKIESEQLTRKKLLIENSRKMPCSETPPSVRGTVNKSRYLDRFRGSFFKYGYNNAKGVQNAAVPSTKPSKPAGWSVGSARQAGDSNSNGHVPRQVSPDADSRVPSVANHRPAVVGQPQPNVWKNRTHELFKNSLPVSPSPNPISTPIAPPNPISTICSPLHHSSRNNTSIVQTLPFSSHPFIDCPVGSNLASLVSQVAAESLSSVDETFHSSNRSEEGDLFEDPCYVPDPVDLLGPISESLDNFHVDVGSGFGSRSMFHGAVSVTNVPLFKSIATNDASSFNLPTLLDMPGINTICSMGLPSTPAVEDSLVSRMEGSIASDPSIWRMWGSLPKQNPLGVIDDSSSWLLPIKEDESQHKVVNHPFCNHTPSVTTEGQPLSGTYSPLIDSAAMSENGDSFATLDACLTDSVPWIQKAVFRPLSNDTEKKFHTLKLQETPEENAVSHDSPSKSSSGLLSEHSWPKEDWPLLGHRSREDGKAALARPGIGGLLPSDSHVQSLWSFS